jgi:hypothetical protein
MLSRILHRHESLSGAANSIRCHDFTSFGPHPRFLFDASECDVTNRHRKVWKARRSFTSLLQEFEKITVDVKSRNLTSVEGKEKKRKEKSGSEWFID